MNRVARDDLHALLSAVVDDTIREDQAAELVRVLASDADARRFYIRYLDMHAALAGAASRPASVPVRGWRVPWVAVVMSLVAASLMLAWLVVSGSRRGGFPEGEAAASVAAAGESLPSYVGTVASASDDAVLNGEGVVPGMRLTAGPYAIVAGGVTVQFDGGARVFLTGQAQFTLRSRRAMAIERGTFVFQGDQTCEQIEIVTPRSVFRNIGTRYAAVIGDQAEEVHVAEGAVRRTTAGASESQQHELIEAGVGRRYGSQEHAGPEAIPLDVALVESSAEESSSSAVVAFPAVVDDFRGDGDRIDGSRSGSGWAEPWRSKQGAIRLVSPGLMGEGSSAVLHDGSGSDASQRRSAAHRQFQPPIDLSQDGIWYLRFLVRRGPTVRKDEHRAMVVLRKRGRTPEEEMEQSALIQIALRKDDVAMVRVADTLTRVSLPQVPGQTYAVVAKIVAGRLKPDQVLVRVMAADRLAGSEEPVEWSLISDGVSADICLDQLSLEFTSRGRIECGDVAIGPTWQSITARPGAR